MVGIITKENWNFRWETYPWTTMSTTDPTRIVLGFKPKLLSENIYGCTVHLHIIALLYQQMHLFISLIKY